VSSGGRMYENLTDMDEGWMREESVREGGEREAGRAVGEGQPVRGMEVEKSMLELWQRIRVRFV
jgi:hypothetical protein